MRTPSPLLLSPLPPHSHHFPLTPHSTPTMSSSNDFNTPEKKRCPSPPAAPAKKRSKKTQTSPTENALLLISIKENGDIASYSSNHAVLAGISGHLGNIDLFLSDELLEDVLDVVGGSGYSSVNSDMYLPEEIAALKKSALIKLFSREIHGGGEAQTGEVFRGTILV